MSSKKLIIGNWKMNPKTWDEAKSIGGKTRSATKNLRNIDVVACPPHVFIHALDSRVRISNFHIGAQTCSFDEEGPHTGEVSAKMLASMGVGYVIVGHSEERTAGDTNEKVNRRMKRVIESGMTAIVCVGEKTHDENGAHLDFLKNQIKETFADMSHDSAKRIIIAYEPVWAIGAKESMVPEQVYEMSIFIRKVMSDIFDQETGMKIKIIYGGSVNFRNAGEIIKLGKVDGLLVGRESVNMPGFRELLKAVDAVN